MWSLKALGVMLALFVLCYITAFGVVRVLRLSLESAVPMIIGVSLLMAVIILWVSLARDNGKLILHVARGDRGRAVDVVKMLSGG